MKRPAPKDRGAVLIAALLLVALMAALSVQLVDVTRFAVFRTGHIDARGDAYWQALGAREFTESVVQREVDGAVMRSDIAWLSEPQVFPVEDGVISGLITDKNNCLNVNALAERRSEGEDLEPARQVARAQRMFDVLMEEIGAPPGQARSLRAQIIDWIDADTRPEPGGAEDQTYQVFDPPYRAANTAMAELEELMALPEMNADVYAFLQPWLCAHPERLQPKINLNTLRLDQAPLLAAALQGKIDAAQAEAVLFRRPPQGYDALDQVWSDPLLADLELDALDLEAFTLRSRWFEMEVEVRFAEARFSLVQLVELEPTGRIVRHRQRFGSL